MPNHATIARPATHRRLAPTPRLTPQVATRTPALRTRQNPVPPTLVDSHRRLPRARQAIRYQLWQRRIRKQRLAPLNAWGWPDIGYW